MFPAILLPLICAAKRVVSVVAINVLSNDTEVHPTTATAFGSFSSDGSVNIAETGEIGTWLLRGAAGDYEIFLSGSGDALAVTSDDLDTWLALDSTRTWTLQASGGASSKSWSGTTQIRRASTGTVLDTGSFVLNATSTGA